MTFRISGHASPLNTSWGSLLCLPTALFEKPSLCWTEIYVPETFTHWLWLSPLGPQSRIKFLFLKHFIRSESASCPLESSLLWVTLSYFLQCDNSWTPRQPSSFPLDVTWFLNATHPPNNQSLFPEKDSASTPWVLTSTRWDYRVVFNNLLLLTQLQKTSLGGQPPHTTLSVFYIFRVSVC